MTLIPKALQKDRLTVLIEDVTGGQTEGREAQGGTSGREAIVHSLGCTLESPGALVDPRAPGPPQNSCLASF